ncbi:GPR1/FUN34/yaaH family-domain-containing protein [Mrakia frigida]|uniref:acetate uptake transporter family protein n=1 Tax=Mrakia frigida TaxID=29902 RepID=UPI003FCC22A4
MPDLEQGTHALSAPSDDHKSEQTQHFVVPTLNRAITPGGHPLDTSQPSFPVYHRKLGNPGPLGLFSFAITTFVLSMFNIGVRGITHPNVVVGMCFGVGGLAQLLAGQWEFAVGNTFGATAFSAYGTFWISFGLIYWPSSGILTADYAPGELASALGIYLIGWFVFTFIMALGTLKASVELAFTFWVLDCAFLMLAVGEFTASTGCHTAGGYLGIIAAFSAMYCGATGILTPETSHFTLPSYDLSGANKAKKN